MTFALIFVPMVSYLVMVGAVFQRNRRETPEAARARHRKHCPISYYGVTACPKHASPSSSCEECWEKSYLACRNEACAVDYFRLVLEWISAVFWLPLAPLAFGRRIGRRKRVLGFRVRRAEKVAKRIADLEKDVLA